ncbi:MAG: peptide deformylase, partial [bacterium]
DYTGGDVTFINPEITRLSREKHEVEEGCLSVRWLYGKMKRSKKASVRAYDENGKRFERGASGLLAQIFQHETDHLEGVLFIDHAYDVQEVLPEDMEK